MPVWRQRHGRVVPSRVSSSPIERPTVTPRPTTDDVLARRSRRRGARSSSMIPRGVHGSGAATASRSTPSTSRPRFVGCSPSASFAGSIRSRIAFCVDALRQRQLHDVPGHGRVVVELAHGIRDLVLRGDRPAARTWIEAMPTSAQSPVLAGDVRARPGVLADQQRAEPGHDAALGERRDPLGQLGLDRGRRGDAVELLCCHVVLPRTSSARRRLRPVRSLPVESLRTGLVRRPTRCPQTRALTNSRANRAGVAGRRLLLRPGYSGNAGGERGHPGAQRLDIGVRQQRERDDVGDLGELARRRTRGWRAPGCRCADPT